MGSPAACRARPAALLTIPDRIETFEHPMRVPGDRLFLGGVLFLFWVVLSGKFDAAHLGAGAVTAAVLAVAAGRLLQLSPAIGAADDTVFAAVRWTRVARYLVWLAWEVVISAVQVAWVVLQPRMPIAPRLLRFRANLPHTLARLTLANSITLTPGTVTLEVDSDEFVVHALTPGSAASLETGAMRRRVAELFDPEAVQ